MSASSNKSECHSEVNLPGVVWFLRLLLYLSKSCFFYGSFAVRGFRSPLGIGFGHSSLRLGIGSDFLGVGSLAGSDLFGGDELVKPLIDS